MSGTMAALQRTMSSASDLQSVVRSMKALAASSITQYEQAVTALEDYSRTVELGLSVCLRRTGPLPAESGGQSHPECPIGAIVFGSDQGLVGRFNEAVVEHATTTLSALPGEKRKVWAVGERVHALLLDSGLAKVRLLAVPNSVDGIAPLITKLLVAIGEARDKEGVREVRIFHNHPKQGTVYSPVDRTLLPLDQIWRDRMVALPWPTKRPAEVIEDVAQSGLDAFVRGYLFILLFQASAASLASENASRLAAMQRAEKNIDEILDRLGKKFHRLRQESIDEELFDVVSGYEAFAR